MNNLKFVQLEAYKPPIAVEDKRNEWVAYGQDNYYLTYCEHTIEILLTCY